MSITYEQLEPVITALDGRIKTNSGALADKADADDVASLETAIADKADSAEIGDLSQLTTTAKDNLVSAINEVSADAKATGDAINEVRADLSNLQDVLETGREKEDITITWGDGYVNLNGLVAASQYSGFALVPMHENETVKIGTANSNITIIGTTTADSVAVGDTITPIYTTSSSGTWEEFTYTASSDINIVLCVTKSNYSVEFTDDIGIVKAVKQDLENVKEQIESISPSQLNFVNAVTNVFDSSTLSTGYIGNSGDIESNSSFRYTDFIPVKSGDKVRFTYNGSLSSQSCQYYNGSKSFFVTGRYVTTAIDTTYQESTVPSGAEYIRINLGAYQISGFVVVINAPYDASIAGNTDTVISLKDGYNFIYGDDKFVKLDTVDNGFLFKKICCIGDSLTEGQYGTDSTTGVYIGKHDGYPYFLARLLNCETENLGLGGHTTKTWWQDKDSRFTSDQLNYSKYDCFILFFGTNGGLNGTVDPDEDSMLGYYAKIIESIRTSNSTAPIFLIVSPWTQNRDSYGLNNWITQIGLLSTAYNLPVLQLDESEILTYGNRLANQPFDKVLHYGRLGYLRMASEIKRCITEVINATPESYATLLN